MAWKGVHLSRPAYLSLLHNNLQISFRDNEGSSKADEKICLPLEDIDYLIIDTSEASLSGPLLSALASSSVFVLGVDEKHMPCWASFPWTAYYRQGDTLSLQTGASLPLQKQLWARIIRYKIIYQARCLRHCSHAEEGDALEGLASRVLSGDTDNTEARAARIYWESLFGDRSFIRHDDDLPNALLNYGYALLRAALARNLCAIGFIPQIGLHHCSQSNAFNLADDLIEPYRPFVDEHAVRVLGKSPSDAPLTTQHRRQMVELLTRNVLMGNETLSLTTAMERTVTGLKQALNMRDAERLPFPDF
jgi:CRISP-associated protein Cas1